MDDSDGMHSGRGIITTCRQPSWFHANRSHRGAKNRADIEASKSLRSGLHELLRRKKQFSLRESEARFSDRTASLRTTSNDGDKPLPARDIDVLKSIQRSHSSSPHSSVEAFWFL